MKAKIILTIMIMCILSFNLVLAEKAKNGNQFLVQEQEQARYQVRANVSGLEQAQLMVRNQEQNRHLEQVMLKIDEQRKTMLNNLDDLKIQELNDGSVQATGDTQVKFLWLFKMQKQFKYQITEQGEVYRIRNRLIDWMFKEV